MPVKTHIIFADLKSKWLIMSQFSPT